MLVYLNAKWEGEGHQGKVPFDRLKGSSVVQYVCTVWGMRKAIHSSYICVHVCAHIHTHAHAQIISVGVGVCQSPHWASVSVGFIVEC